MQDFNKVGMYSNVQERPETLPRILSVHKDLVKGHLSESFVESIDEQPNDSKSRSSLVGF